MFNIAKLKELNAQYDVERSKYVVNIYNKYLEQLDSEDFENKLYEAFESKIKQYKPLKIYFIGIIDKKNKMVKFCIDTNTHTNTEDFRRLIDVDCPLNFSQYFGENYVSQIANALIKRIKKLDLKISDYFDFANKIELLFTLTNSYFEEGIYRESIQLSF